MTISASVQEKAKTFAKTNKISQSKLIEFLESLSVGAKPVGRKASQSTLEIRQRISKWLDENKGKSFTMKDLAKHVNASALDATNAVKWLQQSNKASVQMVGKLDKLPGQRGKRAAIYCVK